MNLRADYPHRHSQTPVFETANPHAAFDHWNACFRDRQAYLLVSEHKGRFEVEMDLLPTGGRHLTQAGVEAVGIAIQGSGAEGWSFGGPVRARAWDLTQDQARQLAKDLVRILSVHTHTSHEPC